MARSSRKTGSSNESPPPPGESTKRADAINIAKLHRAGNATFQGTFNEVAAVPRITPRVQDSPPDHPGFVSARSNGRECSEYLNPGLPKGGWLPENKFHVAERRSIDPASRAPDRYSSPARGTREPDARKGTPGRFQFLSGPRRRPATPAEL